jgi:hypothetical protein
MPAAKGENVMGKTPKESASGKKKPDDPPGAPLDEDAGIVGFGVDLFDVDPWRPNPKLRILSKSLTPIDKHSLVITGYNDTYADSFLQLVHTLAVEAGLGGSYGDFSGSVSSKFGKTEKRIEKRHLQQISFTVSAHSVVVAKSNAALKDLLDPEFKKALATLDIDDLFRQYGTHLAKKITIGGRAEYFCQTADIFSMTKTDFEVIAKAKYKSAGGKVTANNTTGTTDLKKQKLVSGSENINTIGGSPQAARRLQEEDGWAKWAKSCAGAPGFLGYDTADGLVPIWELTDDQARRTAIRDRYQRKAAKAFTTHITSVTSGVERRPEARITVPKGYKLLSGGARVNWKKRGNMLTASFPEVGESGESADTWIAAGKEHLGELDGWTWGKLYYPEMASITVFAIALYDPDNIWETKSVYSDDSPSRDGDSMSLHVDISRVDGTGFVMVGGGARVFYQKEGNLLFESGPQTETLWLSGCKSHLAPEAARLRTYMTALRSKVDGIKVLSRLASAGESPDSKQPIATATTSQGYVMTGGGALMLFRGGKGLFLTASYPKDSDTWEGRGKDHVLPNVGRILVECIGIKVVDA